MLRRGVWACRHGILLHATARSQPLLRRSPMSVSGRSDRTRSSRPSRKPRTKAAMDGLARIRRVVCRPAAGEIERPAHWRADGEHGCGPRCKMKARASDPAVEGGPCCSPRTPPRCPRLAPPYPQSAPDTVDRPGRGVHADQRAPAGQVACDRSPDPHPRSGPTRRRDLGQKGLTRCARQRSARRRPVFRPAAVIRLRLARARMSARTAAHSSSAFPACRTRCLSLPPLVLRWT